MSIEHQNYIPFCIAMALTAAHQPAFADPAGASSTSAASAQQSTNDSGATDYNGGDYTRPENRLELRFSNRSSGVVRRTYRRVVQPRIEGEAPLNSNWKFGWRAQLPLVDRTTIAPDPMASDHIFGIGNLAVRGVLVHDIDARWAFGFGTQLVAPTAQDPLRTNLWRIMPEFGIRYSILELGSDTYFVPKIRYALSFAGDPGGRVISEPQIAPTLNVELPDRWFVTFYPSFDIRINNGTPIRGQTGRLFLPFDAALGMNVTDTLDVSLEVGVPIIKDYPVYNFKTLLRTALQF
ncbi:MAG: hypothetical protein ACYC5H_04270 [Methylovirgula sp.]